MKKIALVGAESTGKSTLAHMLTGRLRTRGVLAVVVAESGSELPFAPSLLDYNLDAHHYMITAKMAAESRAALRPNVNFIISDRTPFDHACYLSVKLGIQGPASTRLFDLALAWLGTYDRIYFLRLEGSTYVEDGFRAPGGINCWRDPVDRYMASFLGFGHGNLTVEVKGDFRSRCEHVYHDVLSYFFAESRPLRAYAQIRAWLQHRGWRIKAVRPQGSNSVTRFHVASDHDDIDAMVIVDGDTNYAIEVRQDFLEHKEHIENVVQASLDLLITPAGLEAYET